VKPGVVARTGARFCLRFVANKLGFYKPFFAQWEITYRCNLRCVFCNVYKDRSYDKTELDTEQAFELLNELQKAGVVFLNLTGGEPLIREDIHLILRHAKRRGLMVTMNCNATLIREKIDLIKEYVDTIHFSLDSDNGETYHGLRGARGVFNQVIEGIRIAKENKIHVGVNMTVTRENFREMEKVCSLAKSLGVDLFFTPVSVIPTEFKEDSQSPDILVESLEYYGEVKRLKKKYPFVKTPEVYLEFVRNQGFDNYECKAMRYMLNIKPDGSVVIPCGYFPSHKFHGRIGEIIRSEGFKEAIKRKKYRFCKDCTLSCNFIPTALMDPLRIISMIKGYLV
jgi:MoaA/NifB/PqqE/SkfB family radical SAM enzyme